MSGLTIEESVQNKKIAEAINKGVEFLMAQIDAGATTTLHHTRRAIFELSVKLSETKECKCKKIDKNDI
jgi:hypothetical protein